MFNINTNHVHYFSHFFVIVVQGFKTYFNGEFTFTFVNSWTQKNSNSQHRWCVVSFPTLCYLTWECMSFGRNIDRSRVKMKARVEHLLFMVFNYFYIITWSCMKLEDALKFLPMLILKIKLDWFFFI
jgi:hypothetical protein